jgi:phosphocarrier protein FPr
MNDTVAGTLTLKAPLTGVMVALERVPDPVFSQKMVGDGISIDPLGDELVAPCDGKIIQVHSAGHACTLATREGIEVMMHIGIDTVNLKGEGFTPKIREGDKVSTGQPLIGFDPDYLALHAKSLLTQILITNGERVAEYRPATGTVTAGTDPALELILAADTGEAGAAAGGESVVSDAILIPNPTGLHARPAAVLANLAKQFSADIRLRKGEQEANAKSVVSVMSLEVGHDDKVVIVATGADAEAAIEKLTPEIASGLGDEGTRPAPAPATVEVDEEDELPQQPRSEDPNILLGVSASPGVAVGNVLQVRHEEPEVPEAAKGSPHDERRRLDDAIDAGKVALDSLQAKLRRRADAGKAAIFAAHAELLEDPELIDLAQSAISKGKSAEFAWRESYSLYADRLATLDNELLQQRANDLRDVGRRVLDVLLGIEEREAGDVPPETILVAEDLTPSDTASLDKTRVLGFCTVAGGASSHVAILARSLDIPAVAGIEPRALEIPDGTPVVLNGATGQLRMNPNEEEIRHIRDVQARLAEKREKDLAAAHEPAVTTDGTRIEVAANIGGLAEAKQGVELGAEGVGLLRSEFLFLDRATAPTEDEQAEVYSEIARALGPDRPLIIRTLDVGGDKPLPYVKMPREENPFLGIRGVRLALTKPGLLRTQIRAILKSLAHGRIRVMFPMIATMGEIRQVRAAIEEEREKLGAPPLEVGIMVEVPAAAVMAEQFAREVDFFSVGTNDLTQYTLAMDRGHPRLAPQADGLNPAVLKLIGQTVEGGRKHDAWVGVCGGIASDPQAVPILIGLGVSELSVSVPSIPAIKAEVRELSLADCQALAEKALAADTAAEVRALVPDKYALV